MNVKKYQVLIIGCGPTGVVLANLLAKAGIKTAVLEKEKNIYPVPRATHIDEESLRNLQLTGLMESLIKYTNTVGYADVVDEDYNILFEENVIDTNSIHGFAGSCFFDQPAFEKILRDELVKYSHVTLFSATEAVSAEYFEDQVHIKAKNNITHEDLIFGADWVIGCDGGRSFVREQENISMDSRAPKKYWLIVDTLLKDIAEASLLPDRFRYVLNPERLTIYAYGFGNNRRWEFQLEEGEPIPDQSTINHWLSKFIASEKLEVIRVLSYTHNSLVAKDWRKNRMFIAGDAAHMMPPSAGQGMCSGIRDAVNLAWKLTQVINNNVPEDILDTYEEERKPHVTEILKGSLFISERLEADTDFQKRLRELQFKIVQKIPPLKSLLRHASLRRIPLKSGFFNKEDKLGGHHLPQFTATRYRETYWSDDLLSYQFALITLNGQIEENLLKMTQQMGIKTINLEVNYPYFKEKFNHWFHENNIEYAIVRPDLIIYSTGKMSELGKNLKKLSLPQ